MSSSKGGTERAEEWTRVDCRLNEEEGGGTRNFSQIPQLTAAAKEGVVLCVLVAVEKLILGQKLC